MTINKNLFLNLCLFTCCIAIFIGYMIGNLYIILFISVLFAIITKYMFSNNKIYISINNFLWILCILVSSISLIYSNDKRGSINFIFMLVCAVCLKVTIESISDWQGKFIKIVYIFSSIHVLSTILYYIYPNLIQSICHIILPNSALETNLLQYKLGNIAGITGQTGVNAFYISIFIGVVFSKILYSNKNIKFYIFQFIIGILSISLTGKRGIFLTTIASCIILLLIIKKNNKRNVFKVLILASIFILVLVIIFKYSELNNVAQKFKILSQESDITNGRRVIWKLTFKNFTINPLLGSGINSISSIIGELTHNIYIQLLSDLGLIGFTIFFLTFVVSIFKSIKLFKKLNIYDSKGLYYISVSIYIQCLFLFYGLSGNPLYGVIFFMSYIMSISISECYKNNIVLKGRH